MTESTAIIDEILPGVFRLEEIDGYRLLCIFVVISNNTTIIVDAGLPNSPARTVIPFIEQQVQPESTDLALLITHPDADHCGGTAALRSAFPGLRVVAHAEDCPPIGGVERTIRTRYKAFAETDAIVLSEAEENRIRSRLGEDFSVDYILREEKQISLGELRPTVLHIPGHSAGHAGLWMPSSRTLIAGDAIMGYGIRNCDGSLLYPPQFISPSIYRQSIERIQKLNVDLLLCAHEKPLRGEAVKAFLQESLKAIAWLEEAVHSALAEGAVTLAQVCRLVHESYGGLPAERGADLSLSVAGILSDLQCRGEVTVDQGARPRLFRMVRS